MYCKIGITCISVAIFFSVFSISNHICVTVISLSGIFSDRLLHKINMCFSKIVQLLNIESEYNWIQWTFYTRKEYPVYSIVSLIIWLQIFSLINMFKVIPSKEESLSQIYQHLCSCQSDPNKLWCHNLPMTLDLLSLTA